MKKTIILILVFAALALASQAQRLVLVEEFTGENCGPCADENPRLNSLMNANTTKALLLRYQSPIPSAGPIHNQYPSGVMARLNYYGCYFAPWGEVDGREVGSGQYPAYVAQISQASIDAASAVPSPFSILLSTAYNSAKDSLVITVKITASSAYTASGLKLRLALAETLHFTTAPGDNGERHFEHVVRMLYPDASGTTLPDTWTAGQSQTFTMTGPVPAYVNKSNALLMAAWVQKDATKEVLQAQRTAISSPTGFPAPAVRDSVRLFPNPAARTAYLELSLAYAQQLSLSLSDGLGRTVYSLPPQRCGKGVVQLAVPVENLPPGLYFLQLTAAEKRRDFRLLVAH